MKNLKERIDAFFEERANTYACIALQLSKKRLQEFLGAIHAPRLKELTISKLNKKCQLINATKYVNSGV